MRRAHAVCSFAALAWVAGCTASAPPAAPVATAPPPAIAPATDAGPTDAGSSDASAAGALPMVFLGNLVVARGAPGKIGGSGSTRLEIHGELAEATKELALRGLASTRTNDGLEITIHGYPIRKDAPRPRDRAASFVIDFDTDVVRGVKDRASAEHGKTPAMTELTRFVTAYIDKKNLARGYDPASVVAKRHEGDCTEHAVLLTALARSFGVSARVVHGFVFVDTKGHLFGAMHAWVEWHDGKKWTLADAAIGEEHDPLYLPLQTLEDESPAYARGLVLTASEDIRRVVVTPR